MSVTGSNWVAKKLTDAINGLDDESIANTTSELQNQVDQGQQRIDQLTQQLQALTDGINQVSTTLGNVQTKLTQLVGNALQTGAYVHLLGLDGRINNNNEFLTQVERALFDTSDPNRPDFVGTTASVGGLVLLVGAPSPIQLRTELFRLGSVFPELRKAVGAVVEPTVEAITGTANDVIDTFRNADDVARSLTKFQLPSPRDVIDIFGREVFPNEGRDARNRWFTLRLSDLMPMFNPDDADDESNFPTGSLAGSLLSTANSVSNALLGTISRADSLANSIERIQSELRDIVIATARLQRDLDDLQNNAANTGVFTHYLGLDFSLRNNRQYLNAVAATLSDQTDPNRPLFVGDNAYVAGLIFFIGVPNPGALAIEFERFKSIFKEK